MSKYTIKLPIIIDCIDYHEFFYMENFFQKLNKDIKIKEIGFDGAFNTYIGIVYIGTLSKDEENELLELEHVVIEDGWEAVEATRLALCV